MPISEIFAELWAIRVSAVDLYLRGCDIAAALGLRPDQLERRSLVDRLSTTDRDDTVRQIAKYVQSEKRQAARLVYERYGERIPPEAFHIPAVATFIPELSSGDLDTAHRGAVALNSMVALAERVGAKVVEFVMGKTVERCRDRPLQDEHHCDYVHEHDPREQIPQMVGLLKAEVCPAAKQARVRLAAEIEPGFSYVLNDLDRVAQYIDSVHKAEVEDLLGLNLDIGHLLIVNTSAPGHFEPGDMLSRSRHIFHAHCSDNVGYHFRDLVPGTVHNLFSDSDMAFQPWVDLCLHCAENDSFSGYVAVELEGCGRFQWVQRSLLRLGHLIRIREQQVPVPLGNRGGSSASRGGQKTMRAKSLRIRRPLGPATILILTVRPDELAAIESVFRKYCVAKEALQFLPDRVYYEGYLRLKKGGKRVRIVVAQISDTGNEASGVDTSHYIGMCKEVYGRKPLYAMLVGICAGSRQRHAELGDVVVPPMIFDDSVYKVEWREDGREKILREIRVPGVPDANLFELCRGIANKATWTAAIDAIDMKRPKKPRIPSLHDDPLMTENAFLQDGGVYLEECRLSINRKLLAYEMEAGGFARACHRRRVPFLVVRGISDFADETAPDKTFWPYAAMTAAAFAMAIAGLGLLPDE
jgi:nucleoside phosphorylase/sugar phosphate isomerase/epimerase